LSANSEAEAVTAYLKRLQRILDCVSQDVVHVTPGGYQRLGQPHEAMLNRGKPTRLGRTPALLLNVALRYTIVREETNQRAWAIQTVGYIYSLRDDTDTEFLAYHWHPSDGSRVRHPHLHIRDGALSSASPLRRAHVATGMVALEDVIQTAIEEFGVPPRQRHQHDWRDVLVETRAAP
jgi:pyruvate-formate lyase-activating enzyme